MWNFQRNKYPHIEIVVIIICCCNFRLYGLSHSQYCLWLFTSFLITVRWLCVLCMNVYFFICSSINLNVNYDNSLNWNGNCDSSRLVFCWRFRRFEIRFKSIKRILDYILAKRVIDIVVFWFINRKIRSIICIWRENKSLQATSYVKKCTNQWALITEHLLLTCISEMYLW